MDDARARSAQFDMARKFETHREAWLLGQSPLGRYLDFVADFVEGGKDVKRAELVDEWRRANDYYAELETREAFLADKCEVRPLSRSLRALAREIEHDPIYLKAYDELPARIAMVQLDHLVVPQPNVNLDHVERLKASLGPTPQPENVFRFCLPLDRAQAQVEMRRMGGGKYQLWSRSSDFRFLEARMLNGADAHDVESHGRITDILGLLVGYGSNFLTAIQSDERLLLHNGHHRAYALRALGVTHAPCIVQTVTRRDELNLVASRTVTDDPAFWFKSKRPPMLKDFFDPRIVKVLRTPPIVRVIELSYEIRETEIRDFVHAD
jgi:hypothetical protein